MAVVKDEAYGHGALDVARIAVEEGAWGFGLSTLEEAMTLRDGGITAPLLLLGERQEAELEWCVAHDLTVCVNEPHNVRALAKIAAEFGKQVPVHVKIHTGMSRYGVRWDEALPLIEKIVAEKSLSLEGVMTHFSQSDETDKTFANLQFSRFNEVLTRWRKRKFPCRSDTPATAAVFWICRTRIWTWCAWAFCSTAFFRRKFAGQFPASSR